MNKLLPKSARHPKGFTLVELLVVVTILAILGVIGITVFSGSQKSARDSKRKQDVKAIADALESRYNSQLNQFCTGNAGTYCAPVAANFASNAIPLDPSSNASYIGLPADGVVSWTICAVLEGGFGNASDNTGTSATGAAATRYCLRNTQ